MLAHLLVGGVAALVTALAVPLVVRVVRRLGVLERRAAAGGRRGAEVPSMGGLAMLAGFLAALAVAWLLPGFAPLFETTSEPLALLVGAVVITALGVADDVLVLPPTVKLAGQVVATLGVVVLGVQLVHFWVPGLEIVALSPDLGLVLTVLALVAMINAVNLIDGLDGLAAGVVAIGAAAFFVFAVQGGGASFAVSGVPSSASLVAAIVVGMCLGFLLHNWHPASVFMGDTGSMLLGLLLGAAGVSFVGRSAAPTSVDFYGSIPLLVPGLVLAIPFLDGVFAVVRRALARRPIAAGDHGHLHHLLLAFGHSHRRAVLVLYYWSALLAFGSVLPAFAPVARLLPWFVVAAAGGVAVTVIGVRNAPVASTRPVSDGTPAPDAPPVTGPLRRPRTG